MTHNPAAAGRKYILVSLGAIALIWSLAGFGLWTYWRQLALAGQTFPFADEAAVQANLWLPLATAILFSLLVIAGLGVLRSRMRHASYQTDLHFRIIHHTSEAMMVTDAGQRILAVNPAFERITGYSAADVIGQTPRMLSSGRHGPDFYQAMWQSIASTGQWEGEIWDRGKNGEISPRQLRISAVDEMVQPGTGAPLTHYVAVFSDPGAQKAQEARLDYLAHHDTLTGLPNRAALGRAIEDSLAAARSQASRLAVLVIDLDHFKTVNDSLGHHAGDQLLHAVAKRIEQTLGDAERVLRLGGDEFVVILNKVYNTDLVDEKARSLLRVIGEPCMVNGRLLHTSPSIGISLFPDDGESAETLMRNADTAMYYVKANGRNSFQFFAEPMNAAANKRLHLENELWQALAENQLMLHYQPQVDLPSGRVVGLEALVRWQHPERGVISPAEFIPIAEESGLILPLGQWVLHSACRQARQWLDEGIEFGEIAVNISAHQFRQPEFAQSVAAILAETALPAGRLELEITESTLMQNTHTSVATLNALKTMGVQLAIDDFGTGYSSLSYLRRFPFDRLKIDQTFVSDLESDADAASLIASIIALGRSLGLRLVAEGVENSAQVSVLREMECERVQGFHICRPVAAEHVMAVCDSLHSLILPSPPAFQA